MQTSSVACPKQKLDLNCQSFFLQKALKLHHSVLCGRRINVEVTCGGGGKGEQRMAKLRSKIDKMKEKRKKAKLKKKQMVLRKTTKVNPK